jgi:hypothetical protein
MRSAFRNRSTARGVQLLVRPVVLPMLATCLLGCVSDGSDRSSSSAPAPLVPELTAGGTAPTSSAVADDSTRSNTALPNTSPCVDFDLRYVGDGLFAALPSSARFAHGEQTTESGVVPAGAARTFTFNGNTVSIGRTEGTAVVPEPNFDKRVDDGVVVFVKAEAAALPSCILDSVSYDKARDRQD